MTTIDHQQAAIEAAMKKLLPRFLGQSLTRCEDSVIQAISAAEPHLRKKWAEEIIDELDTARATGKVYTYGEVQELIREGAGE